MVRWQSLIPIASLDAARPRNRGKDGQEIRVGWPCEQTRDWAVRLHRAYRGLLGPDVGLLKRELADDECDKNSDYCDGRRIRVVLQLQIAATLPYCTLPLRSLVGRLEVGQVPLQSEWTLCKWTQRRWT